MVCSVRELGAGLAGDARALWPNTEQRVQSTSPECGWEREGGGQRTASRFPRRAGGTEAACARFGPAASQHPAAAPALTQPRSDMDEGLVRLQERQLLEHRDFLGLDYPSLYMCKPKRGMKRDESKETYKLPHRLIEKKRRDRINECIAQLKDLLPEHLKLTTLGHLEKAVVLELTLKHLKALTALTEQQHQKILALQTGERPPKSPAQADLDAFHSGFQTCAKEVLHYLSRFESWAAREQRCAQLLSHLHAVSTQFLPGPAPPPAAPPGQSPPPRSPAGQVPPPQPRCVPVIQRTHAAELSDTDTDSGYGGDSEARPERRAGVRVKQEPAADEPPPAKRLKAEGGGPGAEPAAAVLRPDAALLGSLMALGGGAGGPLGPAAAPLCLPFYFLSPSAAAAYVQPFLDKGLDKYVYPAAPLPLPLLYPGLPAAAAAFPCLSSALGPADKAGAATPAAALLPPFAPGPGADTDLASRDKPARDSP